jgi:uncharacterized CHY-type Zn-finger protein
MTPTTTHDPIRIRFEMTNHRRYECFFCGQASDRESMQPFVYSGQHQNGVICRECLAAPSWEFMARIQHHAEDLTRYAHALSEVADNPPVRPSLAAFNAAVNAEDSRRHGFDFV